MEARTTESSGPELIDLRVIFKWLLRRKAIALTILFAGLALTVYLSATAPTLYRSSAVLWVESKPAGQIDAGPGLDLGKAARVIAESRQTLARTSEIAGEKLSSSGASPLPSGFETGGENQILSLIVTAGSPERSAKLANAWAEAAQEGLLKRAREIAGQNRASIEQQVDGLRSAFEGKQKEFVTLQREAGIDSPENIEKHPAAIRLEELKRHAADRQTELGVLQAEQTALADENISLVDLQEIPRAGRSVTLRRQLEDLEDRRARLRTASAIPTTAPADLKSLQTEIAAIQQEVRATAKALAGRLRNETAALTQDLSQLQQQIKTHDTALQELRAKAAQLKVLSTEMELARVAYEKLSEFRNQLARSDRSEGAARIWERAETPLVPFKTPRWELNLILGLIMSLVFGVGGVIVTELLDDTVRSPLELRNRMGLGTLAAIPAANGGGGEIALKEPASPAAAGLRNLHVALEVNAGIGAPGSHSVLTITAPQKGSGASFASANLAGLFAAAGRKVLLIDANAGAAAALKCNQANGLAELLAGKSKQETIARCGNVDVLAPGAIGTQPLDSARVETALSALKSDYDVVLVDTPPVLAAPHALAFAAVSNATLIVARCGVTRSGELEQTLARLNDAKVQRVFVALNGLDRAESRALGLN